MPRFHDESGKNFPISTIRSRACRDPSGFASVPFFCRPSPKQGVQLPSFADYLFGAFMRHLADARPDCLGVSSPLRLHIAHGRAENGSGVPRLRIAVIECCFVRKDRYRPRLYSQTRSRPMAEGVSGAASSRPRRPVARGPRKTLDFRESRFSIALSH